NEKVNYEFVINHSVVYNFSSTANDKKLFRIIRNVMKEDGITIDRYATTYYKIADCNYDQNEARYFLSGEFAFQSSGDESKPFSKLGKKIKIKLQTFGTASVIGSEDKSLSAMQYKSNSSYGDYDDFDYCFLT